MLDPIVVSKLKERYPNLHPMIFHRSVERSKNLGHLFDVLETIPEGFPLIWCDVESRWMICNDTYQSLEFFKELGK
jgi:hypothetical protein